MVFTYTPGASDLDRVRLLIRDTDADHELFSDEEITSFLDLEDGNVRYAAAQALDTAASNQALILKITQVFDLKVDGVALAKSLREHAKTLREQADSESDDAFDIAQQVFSTAGFTQHLWNQRLRGVL